MVPFPCALFFSYNVTLYFSNLPNGKLEQHCLSTELTKMRNDSSFLFLGCAFVLTFKGRARSIGLKNIGPHVSPNYAAKRIH